MAAVGGAPGRQHEGRALKVSVGMGAGGGGWARDLCDCKVSSSSHTDVAITEKPHSAGG